MAKVKVDASIVANTMEQLKNQPAPVESFSKTDDEAYPVWRPEAMKAYLVYVPMTPVRTNADGTLTEDPLRTWVHNISANGMFTDVRCFNGFTNETLGFDGTCPFCEAAQECGQAYYKKLEFEAKRMGISEIKNNPALESIRTKLNSERVVKRADEYVTFPIVVLSETPSVGLTEADMKNFKVYYMDMRYATYEEKILKTLTSQVPPIAIAPSGAPFGKMFVFNYVYNTNGAKANNRDAVRNAQYSPITDMNYYASAKVYTDYAEQLAASFTNEKAVEVIKAKQLWYHDDYVKHADSVMFTTRAFLSAMNDNTTNPAMTGFEQTLSTFGNVTPVGISAEAPAPAQLGVAPAGVAQAAGVMPTMAQGVGVMPTMNVTNGAVAPQIGAVGVVQ